jgi:hypothetical protein
MYKMTCRAAVIGALAVLAVACGNNDSPSGPHMRLSVVDAPVDDASSVVVVFTGVELTGADAINIDFAEAKEIDLIEHSGTASAELFDTPVPAGSYGQIRLKVLADGDPSNSYIDLADGRHGLQVPSGSQTGLKLVTGFTVPESGVANYTIDFDLRKAITCPPGQNSVCFLKPALRLVADDSVGNIQGFIDATLAEPAGCSPAVYLFAGTASNLEDNNSSAAGTANQPLASKVPVVSDSQLYYQFAFLTPGTYKVAYTCNANDDLPDQADPGAVTFEPVVSGVSVTATQTTDVDLPPTP